MPLTVEDTCRKTTAIVFLSLYFMYGCIDLFNCTAARVFNKLNKLTYLLTVVMTFWHISIKSYKCSLCRGYM